MKTRPKLLIGLIAALLCLWILPASVSAQDTSENMKIVREKVLADRKVFVAANMGLTEAEGKAFWPVYDEYIKELEKLGAKGLALIEDYARNYKSMTDEKAKALLDDYMAFEAEHVKLRQQYLPRFRQAIPEKKVTRYYQIENKIQAIGNYELAAKIPLVK